MPACDCRAATPTISSMVRTTDRSSPSRFFITGRTLVGPVTVGFATTNTSVHSLWFSVGRPVWEGTMMDRGLFR